jgi:hypothetical protein
LRNSRKVGFAPPCEPETRHGGNLRRKASPYKYQSARRPVTSYNESTKPGPNGGAQGPWQQCQGPCFWLARKRENASVREEPRHSWTELGVGDGGSTPSTGAHPVGANAYRVNQPDVPGPKCRGPVSATALRSGSAEAAVRSNWAARPRLSCRIWCRPLSCPSPGARSRLASDRR